jgi:RNA polymerase sigma factor (TIGR02999 family)
MDEVTKLLQQWRAGSREAETKLFELLVPELRRIARSLLKGGGRDHTLQPTALVNELYIRLVAAKNQNWTNRGAFFRYAAKAMRSLLIDHWRRHPRTGLLPLGNLSDRVLSPKATRELVLAVDLLLDEMERDHPDWCAVVEMKFFLGLNNDEVAEAMGISLRTAERMWHDARFWLFERLGPP